MIGAEVFRAELDRRGVGLLTGVDGEVSGQLACGPDGYLGCADGATALAVAAEAELGGVRAAALVRDVGLLDRVTRLLATFDVPLLVFVRVPDERPPAAPGVPYRVLGPDRADLTGALNAADRARAEGKPTLILVPNDCITAS